jgi:hypothetical protein
MHFQFNIAIGNERNQILIPVGNHSKPIAAGFASKEAYLKERSDRLSPPKENSGGTSLCNRHVSLAPPAA